MARRDFTSWVPVAAVAVMALFMGTIGASAQGTPTLESRLKAAVDKLQAACGDDLRKYCSTVTPGGDRIVFCIEAHEDKISTKCEYALFEASKNLERALDRIQMTAEACWGDIATHCADVAPGGGGIAHCLVSKKASLTNGCQIRLDEIQTGK